MAISVFLKALTRRGGQSLSSSSYESVFRNVNTPWNNSLSGKMSSSLGTRAFCSKSDHSDSAAQNKVSDSNLTKVVFKYVCGHDEFQENSRSSEPIIRKVLEIPRGHTFIECRDGDDVSYCNLIDFCYALMRRLTQDAESARGERVTEMCFTEASFFKDRIRSIIDSSGDILNLNDAQALDANSQSILMNILIFVHGKKYQVVTSMCWKSFSASLRSSSTREN